MFLVHGLFERLNEGLDRRNNVRGLSRTHGDDNLVSVELNVFGVAQGLGKNGHELANVQVARKILETRRKDAEGSLAQRQSVVYCMSERSEVNLAFQFLARNSYKRHEQTRNDLGHVVHG